MRVPIAQLPRPVNPEGMCRPPATRYNVGAKMFDRGYWKVGRVRGAPVRIHWSAPLGAFVFTGFAFAPALWLGFIFLILWHELGHAALVRRFGYKVVAVRVHAFGGDCQWSGESTPAEVSVVAWGGVLAQALLGIGALVAIRLFGWPQSSALGAIAVTFTSTNLSLIVFNLIPIPPLDGHRAWQLFPMLWEARKERIAFQRERAAQRRAKDAELVRERARATVRRDVASVDVPEDDLAPMPAEVKAVLDRVMKGDRAKGPRS